MTPPFPLTGQGAWHTSCVWNTAGKKRNGIHYTGDTVTVTLAASGATAYTVYDIYGNQKASGAVSGTSINLGSSWNPGWYRVYFTGPNTGTAPWANEYADTSFVVFPVDTRFPTNPDGAYALTSSAAQGAAQITDNILNAVIGTRSPRGQVGDVTNLVGGSPTLASAETNAGFSADWWTNPATDTIDPGRPGRQQLFQFPNGTVDEVKLVDGSGNTYMELFPKTTVLAAAGASLYVKASAGTSSGTKIEVFYPASGTLVETYDNLAGAGAAATTINGASSYVFAFAGGASSAVAAGPTAVTTAKRDGVISCVQALYPLGVTRFEGPVNEPTLSAKTVQMMKLYADAVHTAQPAAKAVGPSAVDISNLAQWTTFLAGGGGAFCDELTAHAYNFATNGDINLGRNTLQAFQALLAVYGQDTKTLWLTEGGIGTFIARYGVQHFRSAAVPLKSVLLCEQYGIPRERNLQWYDRSHGFWGFPQFTMYQDTSLVPYACLYRTLAAETFGMQHAYRVDFGHPAANAIFLGSLYTSHDSTLGPSCLVVQPACFIDGCQVVFTITGTTSPIDSVDGMGNVTSLTQSSGRVTLPLTDLPSYLRLPAGVVATVYSVNDWGHAPNPNLAGSAVASLGGVSSPNVNDSAFLSVYAAGTGSTGAAYSTASLPDDCELIWDQAITVDRVVVWCGPQWQSNPSLVDFDVDTWDGMAWTTQTTKTRTDQVSFAWASDGNTGAGSRETWAPDVWIEDIKLPTPTSCFGVRVHARTLTYGGEPDAAAQAAGGQGVATPKLAIQEMMALSATIPTLPNDYAVEVLADSPKVFLRMQETAGPTAVSQVNSPATDGTYNGTSTHVPGAVGDGNGLQLVAGIGQAITVPDGTNTKIGNGPCTVEIWANPSTISGGLSAILDKGGSYHVGITSATGTIFFGKVAGTICTSTVGLVPNQWAHIVCTWDGTTCLIYINGADVSGATTIQTLANNTTVLTVGGSGSSNAFLGKIDEFALYPAVLSAAGVAAHYAAGRKPYPPANVTVPAVTGNTSLGTLLACATGAWTNIPTGYSYQWQRDGSNIAGATAHVYQKTAADLGHAITCAVTASNVAGATSVSSASTVPALTTATAGILSL